MEAFLARTVAGRLVALVLLFAGMRVRGVVDATSFARPAVHDVSRRLRVLGSPADAASPLSDAPPAAAGRTRSRATPARVEPRSPW